MRCRRRPACGSRSFPLATCTATSAPMGSVEFTSVALSLPLGRSPGGVGGPARHRRTLHADVRAAVGDAPRRRPRAAAPARAMRRLAAAKAREDLGRQAPLVPAHREGRAAARAAEGPPATGAIPPQGPACTACACRSSADDQRNRKPERVARERPAGDHEPGRSGPRASRENLTRKRKFCGPPKSCPSAV